MATYPLTTPNASSCTNQHTITPVLGKASQTSARLQPPEGITVRAGASNLCFASASGRVASYRYRYRARAPANRLPSANDSSYLAAAQGSKPAFFLSLSAHALQAPPASKAGAPRAPLTAPPRRSHMLAVRSSCASHLALFSCTQSPAWAPLWHFHGGQRPRRISTGATPADVVAPTPRSDSRSDLRGLPFACTSYVPAVVLVVV